MEHTAGRILETSRLLLRPFTHEDFGAMHSWASNPDNVRYMSFGPNSEEETRSFLASAWAEQSFAVVLRASGAVIGSCGVYPDEAHDTGSVGWILHASHWKQGYGTELGGALLCYGFETLRLRRICASCAAVNYGSRRVMERNGMRREALRRKAFWARVDREWIDETEYALLSEEYFAAPRGASHDIRSIDAHTRPMVTAFLTDFWSGPFLLIRGEPIDITVADGFSLVENGALTGAATYIVRGEACELVSLNSTAEQRGVGTALLSAVRSRASALGCTRLQLLTSNDNLRAIGFYQKRGFDLAGVNLGAIDRERLQKPSIPLIGQNGIPIHHEIEFSMRL